MHAKKLAVLCLGVTGLIFSLGLTGCSSARIKPRAWDVNITKSTPATIEVDLIGIREDEKTQWEAYNLNDYWTPGDTRREHADKLTRSLNMDDPWDVKYKDPAFRAKWDAWLQRGACYLVIIANLPGSFEPGPADPRRIIVTLDKNAWRGKVLKFEVFEKEVRPETPPK